MENRSEKKITIDQVAKACGVSKATISRFLNGRYENISPATCERIRSVIDELGYRPNRSAQRLKSGRSMLIGCVVGDMESPFAGMLLRGISAVCSAAGYQVLFAHSGENAAAERKAIEEFVENSVDGLIVNTAGGNDAFLSDIDRSGTPVVLADRGLETPGILDTVCLNNCDAAYQCVSYLLACGYTRIAFFSEGNGRVYPRVRRAFGYTSAVEQLCPEHPEPLIFEFSRHDGKGCSSALEKLCGMFPGERCAIISVNGMTAQDVLLSARELGIRFGRELGFITFDDWDWLRLADPAPTAVNLNSESLGTRSAELLMQRIAEKGQPHSPMYTELPVKLIVRASTVMEA